MNDRQTHRPEGTATKNTIDSIHDTEAAFRLSKQPSLYVSTSHWETKARRYFSHQIVRTPLDFRLHVQRINFEVEQKDSQLVYGALLDLFIALDQQGMQLKLRMLKKAESFLTDNQLNYFKHNLQKKTPYNDPAPFTLNSVLISRIRGNFSFIEKNMDSQIYRDEVEKSVNKYIESGQHEQAIKLLIKNITSNKPSLEKQKLLLSIHRNYKLFESFNRSRGILTNKNIELINEWKTLEQEFLKGQI